MRHSRSPLVLVLAFFLLLPFRLDAKVWEVTDLGDSGNNTLRDRIVNDAAPGDTVWINVSGRIQLSSSIPIDQAITVLGPTPAHMSLDGGGNNRIFRVDAPNASVRIKNLRMVNGDAGADPGGALRVLNGHCYLKRCVVDSSYSDTHGGGIANSDTLTVRASSIMSCRSTPSGKGAGIYSDGTLYLRRSTVADNFASDAGGGVMLDTADHAVLHFNTIVHNESQDRGGGLASTYTSAGTFRIGYNIIDTNLASVSAPEVFSDDSLNSDGFNMIPDTSGGLIESNPYDYFGATYITGLGTYSNFEVNGHGYKYFPLPDTSDAIEAGPANSTFYGLDQRLAPRVLDGDAGSVGARVDLGSVEYTPYVVTSDGTISGTTLDNVLSTISGLTNYHEPYYIAFDLPSGNTTISNGLSYDLSVQTIVDGWSQEGSKVPGPPNPNDASQQVTPGTPLVEIDGQALSNNAFTVLSGADGCGIRGLSIYNHSSDGIEINADSAFVSGNHLGLSSGGGGTGNGSYDVEVTGSANVCRIGGLRHFQRNVLSNGASRHLEVNEFAGTGHRILGNIVGLMPNGSDTATQTGEGVVIRTDSNLVGSQRLAGSNTISAHTSYGLMLSGPTNPITRNRVIANHIGPDHKGMNRFSNGQGGVLLVDATDNILKKNLISGNANDGIAISLGADSNVIQGNLIGVASDSITPLGNDVGINFYSDAGPHVVGGGLMTDSSNVVSGNVQSGIIVEGFGHRLIGNLIGTGPHGDTAIPNGGSGIYLRNSSDNVQVGGDLGQYGNIISGNGGAGIFSTADNYVEIGGNYIGVDSSGTDTIGNGWPGIYLPDAGGDHRIGDHIVGGDYSNLIGGNDGPGIRIWNSGSFQGDHWIQNNYIGTDTSQTLSLGNLGSGIVLNGDSNLVGGVNGGGNVIANNQDVGIRMDSVKGGNRFYENLIYDNGSLGIDLNGDGVTANDSADTDSGPNDLSNHPNLLGASNCGSTSISFELSGSASNEHRVEFFKVPNGSADPSGHGEGPIFLWADTVTMSSVPPDTFVSTSPSGPVAFASGDSITAVATDLVDSNSSEFASNIALQDSLYLTLDSLSKIRCAGDSNGAARVSLQGGLAPYQVRWYDSSYSATLTDTTLLSGVPAGTYHAVVNDALGCEDTLTVQLQDPDTLNAFGVTIDHETCAGACDGRIKADISGGRTPYTPKWDSLGTGDTLVGDTLENLCPGTYDLLVEDSSGCQVIHGTTVDTGDTVMTSTSPDTSVCRGDSVMIAASGGSSYSWAPSDSLTFPNSDTTMAFPDTTTEYTVTVDSGACTVTDSLQVTLLPQPPSPSASKTDHFLCQGDPVPAIGVAPDPSYENRWYDQASFSSSISSGDTLTGITLSGDTTRRYAALTDTVTGCTGPSLSFVIARFDSSSVSTSGDTSICTGESVQLNAAGGSSYEWTPGEGLSDSNAAEPIARPIEDRTYQVRITGANGCQVNDSVSVSLLSVEQCGLEVYNAFSPDGDGLNETWIIDGIRAYPDNKVTIFNRWGDRVQEFEGYDNEEAVWDGTRSNGRALPSGTYYYVIELSGSDRGKLTGYVQLTK